MSNLDIESIYNRYVDDMFTYAVYLGFDKIIIMDAIQDVFCKFITDKINFGNIENIKFFLFRALKNKLFDFYRAKKDHLNIDTINEKTTFDIKINIEDTLIKSEEQEDIKNKIESMLESLTNRQREIIYLRYVQEYEYTQIAELLNISVNSCRKLHSRAIQTLRENFTILISILILTH